MKKTVLHSRNSSKII